MHECGLKNQGKEKMNLRASTRSGKRGGTPKWGKAIPDGLSGRRSFQM